MADQPLVPPERNLRELTVKALILGALLSAVLAAANAYIGLLVGLTVSASIPAAATSMGILRLFRRSTILENNMVQTAASAGESLAAGIIFTLPALVMMHAWSGYHWGTMTVIGILGGLLGVAFTIPLRRALIVETDLAFPEGQATAQVLKTGGIETDKDHPEYRPDAEAKRGFRMLLQAAAIGGTIKLLESGIGLLAGGIAATKSFLGGRWLFTGDITLSPALLGVGYIVGLNVACLVFMGGVIGTLIGVPINWLVNGDELMRLAGVSGSMADWSAQDWESLAGASWQQCRRIGVGAMMVGGVWSLISLARPLVDGVKASLHAHHVSKTAEGRALRTEHDMPIPYVSLLVLLSIVPLYLVFLYALDGYPAKFSIAAVMSLLMIVLGFMFASVAGYMAGLVGSSNNPISGVTIATVIVSALILLQLMGNEGMAAKLGPIAVMYLAGMICSAAAIAGDNMQDLKCGHILGATPWRQQIFQIVGVVAAAGAIPLVLSVLDRGYGIGRVSPLNPEATPLSAPQASLMRDLSTGIFGAGIEWAYIFIGFALAVVLIVLDQVQKNRGSSFRFPVLAVAVGVYLPLGLSVPIFLGGLLAHWQRKKSGGVESEGKGLLLASGLITGEALMGVLVAILAVTLPGKIPFLRDLAAAPWLGLAGLLFAYWYLARKS
ncbi:putative oligopeptide transporter, OPT family [Microbulbifer donghaiensis]|uniref:Putative oligopeptide transporter, OPT family n=1 Tax=Microbulbifer donghaiensis TaxID=494016 RepID=A0A1M5FEL6_9GAMM|nr:oligopeptide transporter, OPT family [Microbulbifer donghaiensis]SHF89926.1 putative oligopeptide transporter, OPT family [Microbulbifer donghaiensis]